MNILRFILLFISTISILYGQSPDGTAVADTSRKNILSDHIVAFPGFPSPGSKLPAPLFDALASKRVIGIGEVTYGVRDFTHLRTFVARDLAEAGTLRIIALEEGLAEMARVNMLLKNPDVSMNSVLKHFSKYRHTRSMREFLTWLGKYNAGKDGAHQVILMGMDLSSHEKLTQRIADYFSIVDPPYAADLEMQWLPYKKSFQELKKLKKKDRKKIVRIAEAILEQLSKRRDHYLLKSSEFQFLEAEILCKNLIFSSADPEGFIAAGYMDQRYAANLELYLPMVKEEEKVLVFAHNERIAKFHSQYKPLGRHLQQRFGQAYFALQTDFASGKYLAYDLPEQTGEVWLRRPFSLGNFEQDVLRVCKIFDALDNPTMELLLEQRPEAFYLDFATAGEAAGNWLKQRQSFHVMGLNRMDREKSFQQMIPTQRYDGLFFVKMASFSKLLKIR